MRRRRVWRWLGWGSVVVVALVFGWGMMLFLRTPEKKVQADTVDAVVHVHGGSDSHALLVRHSDRWLGRPADFPLGSVAHVRPGGSPGFFLVRDAGGSFHALSDRSPHRGQPLELRDPLPGTSNQADGPQPGFYDPDAGAMYTLDGEPLQGPGPRPLDPFSLALEDNGVQIATRALCPPELGQYPSWCGSGEGPRTFAAGQVVILLPAGSELRVLGGPATGASRRIGDQELRAWGAEVVHSVPELEQLAAGARVLWLHQDALPLTDPAWVRSQYDQGRAVGVLDGTIADLSQWFGLGDNNSNWIQPGTGRPVFAQVQVHAVNGRQQRSDWLTLSWLLTASRTAVPGLPSGAIQPPEP